MISISIYVKKYLFLNKIRKKYLLNVDFKPKKV